MKFRKKQKKYLAITFIVLTLNILLLSGCNMTSDNSSSKGDISSNTSATSEILNTSSESSAEESSNQKVSSTPSNVTVSQNNALKKAQSYIKTSAFSREGLIEQLEYNKFSNEDSVYAVDNCGADWNEQAAKKAKSYLKTSAFSREGLIEQLIYNKFTNEQATYGADANGL